MFYVSLLFSLVISMATEKNAYDTFNAEKWVKKYFPVPGEPTDSTYADFLMKCLARHFTTEMSKVAPNTLKILDYGCGPSIGLSISAAAKASEIVLADYAPASRAYVQKWLDKDPSLCNYWSPFFKYIVETLEGGTEEEAVQREEIIRDKIKAVVSCDMTKDIFIEESYNEKNAYDTVMSFLCLETASKDLTSYKCGMEKLASLVKKGGYLLLCSTRRENCEEGFYVFDGVKYFDICLKRNFIVDVLQENDFHITDEDYMPLPPVEGETTDGFLFFAACKM